MNFVYFMREPGSAEILVWNERGTLVAEQTQDQGCGVQMTALNIQRFAAGVYFYQVRLKYSSGGQESPGTQKFMVLR